MRVMVIVKATKESEAGGPPDAKLLSDMGKFNEQLVKAGVIVSGDGLKASKFGKRVHFSGANRTVTDGPFTETKELIAGYWVWNVQSMDEALAWVKRCPNPHHEDSDIEIRPFFEMADFGDAFTPEARAHEERLRRELENKK
jgi:hypothetical protein